MFGALALGETRIDGLLEGEDVLRTAAALRALGAEVKDLGHGAWRVRGFGVGGGLEPDDVLDLGNSGTSARLLSGILASHRFTSFLTGDASLRRRPMQRVIEPLSRMGARIDARGGGRMPLAIIGTDEMVPIEYRLPVASAQVKSAVLLAGLNTAGETTVDRAAATRDHTERMLRHFGAEVRVEAADGGGKRITIVGWPELKARDIVVPGDPSSAAFAAVAAAVRPGSDVTIENVGLNPLRSGLYLTLREMGANISLENERDVGGEPVADLRVSGAALKGVEVPPERAPTMIDEYPDPCGGGRLRGRHDPHAGPGRAARQGKRSAGQRGGRLGSQRRQVRGGTRLPGGARHRRAAARRRPGGDAHRPSHRHVVPGARASLRASRWRLTTARRSTPAFRALPG